MSILITLEKKKQMQFVSNFEREKTSSLIKNVILKEKRDGLYLDCTHGSSLGSSKPFSPAPQPHPRLGSYALSLRRLLLLLLPEKVCHHSTMQKLIKLGREAHLLSQLLLSP